MLQWAIWFWAVDAWDGKITPRETAFKIISSLIERLKSRKQRHSCSIEWREETREKTDKENSPQELWLGGLGHRRWPDDWRRDTCLSIKIGFEGP